jgi:hypothetical protein
MPIRLMHLATLIPVDGFLIRYYPHASCPSRGIRRSVECHVSLGNHPVKLRDQQHQTGLDQILQQAVGTIARSSFAEQFNLEKCRVLGGQRSARAFQCEPPRGSQVHANFSGAGIASFASSQL